MKLTILGSSSALPTSQRYPSAHVLNIHERLFLVDCGEGTQKQFLIAKLGFNREMRILISHMHADHILGIPGILHSMSFMGRSRDLEIYGPPGICEFVKCTTETVKFRPMFPIRTVEVHA